MIASIILGISLVISSLVVRQGVVKASKGIASHTPAAPVFPTKLWIEADRPTPIEIEQNIGQSPIKINVQQEHP